jgi:hypothetical protein
MKFKILVKNDREEWWESYEEDIDDPEKWANKTINYFNNTLRPGELKRELLDIEVEDESNDNLHRWVKRTDGMSVSFRGQTVDLMYCDKCGITGKRFGTSRSVKIDSKFRKKLFQNCKKSKEELKFLGSH